ncbi:flagellar basal-body MS-ring/collar protein FliF [Enterobacteriaceae bacterium LUAb1]
MIEKFKQSLAGLPVDKLKKWLLPVGGAVAVTAIIIALLWQNNQHYTTLFGSQENIPVAQVTEVLSGEQIAYRVEPHSGTLLVRESELSKARMALAAKGITARTPAGYELMDKEELLGSSQFIQNVRFKRSLEGELAQSIMALDSVDFARVHLGISEASSFVLSNKPDSTASVILRLKYGRELTDEHVAAIVNLVAGSVPGMKSEQVRVVDQRGTLLSSGLASAVNGRATKDNNAVMQRIRHETEQNIAHVLGPVIGRENFRISVVPRINFSQVEETQERYLGEPRVNNENVHQENTTDELAIGIPGSLSNRPPPAANKTSTPNHASRTNTDQPPDNTDKTKDPSSQSTRNQTQRQFNWDRDIRHIRHPGYRIEKLSVAVVVNQTAAAVKAWDETSQKNISQLLLNAAGIDKTRGDTLTMTTLAFSGTEQFEEPILRWWERQNTLDWAKLGGTGLLALLLVVFGVLPMLRRIAANKKPENTLLPNAEAHSDALLTEDSEQLQEMKTALPSSSFQTEDKLPPQSSGLETKINFLKTLAQDETDRVAEVIKQWINSNERSNSN